jgi:hypothetical protein
MLSTNIKENRKSRKNRQMEKNRRIRQKVQKIEKKKKMCQLSILQASPIFLDKHTVYINVSTIN